MRRVVSRVCGDRQIGRVERQLVELTTMIAFQNACAAAARILSTAEEMFDLLNSLLR